MFDGAGHVREGFVEQRGESKAAHSHGIDGEEQEAAVRVQKLRAVGDQGAEPFLDPPRLGLRTSAELGRVEDDAIVAVLPPHLARGELGRIVHQPADGPVLHPGECGVLARLRDRFLARIDMRHWTALAERKRADAGITEHVERLRVRLPRQLPAHPFPHRGHVRKETEMAEWRALRVEPHIVPRKRPAIGHLRRKIPAATAILVRAGDEFAIRLPVIEARAPEGLRLGADEAIGPEALQLAAVSAVDQPVIGPWFADHQLWFEAQLRHQRAALAEM